MFTGNLVFGSPSSDPKMAEREGFEPFCRLEVKSLV
jgi:hypothetical protein